MRNPTSSSRTRPRLVRQSDQKSRSAFTLIELVVVIMIIAILASLLMVGVQGAVARARETAVGVDVKNLEQGIMEFQSSFKLSEPPASRIVLYEAYDDWPDVSTATGTSAAHKSIRQNVAAIRKLWPSFLDKNGKPALGSMWSRDINGNGTADQTFELTGAECLVFFLGGTMSPGSSTGTYIANGFSADPRDPFKSGGTRVGPFTELNPGRLQDTTGNGFPEYIDAFPGSSQPYQYFSAYGGRGYRLLGDNDAVGGTGADADEILPSNSLRAPYLQKDDQWPNPSAMPAIPAGNLPDGTPWSAKGYQIISAGADGQWGIGGETSSDGIRTYDTGTDNYRQPSARAAEKDNITSFKGGRLN